MASLELPDWRMGVVQAETKRRASEHPINIAYFFIASPVI
jgi:hypothetical protein